jgi:hypothetical protein
MNAELIRKAALEGVKSNNLAAETASAKSLISWKKRMGALPGSAAN